MPVPYSYFPTPNSELISQLHLIEHPEGGYFVETDRQSNTVPSPFADGAARSLATSIYYLLTPASPTGFIHMNKSVTYHVLHHGRAVYTLIHPSSPPRVETVVMGTDVARGEVRQLLVGTGVWKMSRIPEADLNGADLERVGCLITEVVVPGFHWEDHKYLTKAELVDMWKGVEGQEERIKEFGKYVKEA